MRFYLLLCLVAALLVTLASAITAQKAVMITYPEDTPASVIENAMDAIRKAGGTITHEYSTAPLYVIDTIFMH